MKSRRRLPHKPLRYLVQVKFHFEPVAPRYAFPTESPATHRLLSPHAPPNRAIALTDRPVSSFASPFGFPFDVFFNLTFAMFNLQFSAQCLANL